MVKSVHILLIDDDPAEEIILRALMSKVENYKIILEYSSMLESAIERVEKAPAIDLVLLDNRLGPGEDFRESVPRLRRSGFIGPIGVISSSLVDPYFQSFEDYGADFRLDKAEFDPTAVEFIIREYLSKL
jgi:DNA-binding NarL/FixJ family response regulator